MSNVARSPSAPPRGRISNATPANAITLQQQQLVTVPMEPHCLNVDQVSELYRIIIDDVIVQLQTPALPASDSFTSSSCSSHSQDSQDPPLSSDLLHSLEFKWLAKLEEKANVTDVDNPFDTQGGVIQETSIIDIHKPLRNGMPFTIFNRYDYALACDDSGLPWTILPPAALVRPRSSDALQARTPDITQTGLLYHGSLARVLTAHNRTPQTAPTTPDRGLSGRVDQSCCIPSVTTTFAAPNLNMTQQHVTAMNATISPPAAAVAAPSSLTNLTDSIAVVVADASRVESCSTLTAAEVSSILAAAATTTAAAPISVPTVAGDASAVGSSTLMTAADASSTLVAATTAAAAPAAESSSTLSATDASSTLVAATTAVVAIPISCSTAAATVRFPSTLFAANATSTATSTATAASTFTATDDSTSTTTTTSRSDDRLTQSSIRKTSTHSPSTITTDLVVLVNAIDNSEAHPTTEQANLTRDFDHVSTVVENEPEVIEQNDRRQSNSRAAGSSGAGACHGSKRKAISDGQMPETESSDGELMLSDMCSENEMTDGDGNDNDSDRENSSTHRDRNNDNQNERDDDDDDDDDDNDSGGEYDSDREYDSDLDDDRASPAPIAYDSDYEEGALAIITQSREQQAAFPPVSEDDVLLDPQTFDNLLQQNWCTQSDNILVAKVANRKKLDDGTMVFHVYNGLFNAHGVDLLVPWAAISLRWDGDDDDDQ